MKKTQFIIFFSIVFTVYFLINYYIFKHGTRALAEGYVIRLVYYILFFVFAFSFIIGRFLERIWPSTLAYSISMVGSIWLAAMVYFFLICLVLDILSLFPFPVKMHAFIDSSHGKFYLLIGAFVFVTLLISYGYINARNPRIKTLSLDIQKQGISRNSIKIVAVTDVHMGSIIGIKRVRRLIKMINRQKAELVLFAGDLLDEDTGPVVQQNLGSCLENIHADFGVYAITGNHEYIGGVHKAVPFLNKHGIKVLQDEWVLIDNLLYIAGREDRDMRRYMGKPRKSLDSLLQGTDSTKALLVLDHQPLQLHESQEAGADLQISGHTHHGQIWPFQLITKKIFEISWGYMKKGNTHYYVSSGFGTWGPPIRIGNRPEIVVITLNFRKYVKS